MILSSTFGTSRTGNGGRHLLLFLALLDVLSAKVGIGHGHDHQAFIQSDSDLRYLVDDGIEFVETITHDDTSHGTPEGTTSSSKSLPTTNDNTKATKAGDEIKVLRSPIQFDPAELDFKEQPIGLPIMRKVRVHNLNAQSSIQMLSISGNTNHFHCSFFTDKVIPPSGNTTFDVVFLGREEGPVENTLYIHTSAGSFRFNVKAKGTPNPYRLRPLVGVKMPINSSFSPLIQLHNPHPEPIQVLEMYSSGGDLHLELPDGQTEGSESVWQIPPYQTKPVMKANFVARLESNHTAYIRIKTNTTGAEFLYLPLEVEVTSQPGIYSPQDMIDFGLVPTGSNNEGSEPAKTVKLLVMNSGIKPIQIQNVVATPVSEAVSINFKPLKIQPETLRPKVVAEMVFNPQLVQDKEGPMVGKILIKSKNSQFKAQIPYRAFLLKGQLMVNNTATQFHLRNKSKIQRNVTVKNEFGVPVAVHNLSLGSDQARRFFDLLGTSDHPVILKPGETKDLSLLSLKDEAWEDRILNSHLTIATNVSNIHVPLLCFHGLIETFFPGSPSQDILDFGTLGMGEKRDIYFAILNKNPISVTLRSWGASLPGSLVEVIGVDKGNECHIMERGSFDGMTRKLIIPPDHYLIFRLGLHTSSDTEGGYEGQIAIDTSYHQFAINYKFRVAKGSLNTVPKDLIFDPVFPGQKAEIKLKVFSSFAEEMITDSVGSVPADPRFTFRHAIPDGRTVIMSGEKSFVGLVKFDPAANCRANDSCYVGFHLDSKMGKEWKRGLSLPKSLSGSDYAITATLSERFRTATSPSASFNITLNLDTNHVRGFLFKARAKLIWPSIGPPNQRLNFPLTQVGNWSWKDVLLSNPSNADVVCHLVPLSDYPNGHDLISILGQPIAFASENRSDYGSSVPFSNESNYRLISVLDLTHNSPLQPLMLDENLASATKAFVLKSKSKARIKIKFHPQDVGLFKSGLYIRNNLTGIEFVEFFGEAVHGELKFGKFKSAGSAASISAPASDQLLEFEMKEKHLKGCKEGKKSSVNNNDHPLFTVKRTFKVKNLGMTSFYVKGFNIETYPCEGYGFKVLNCEGFSLQPDESKDVHIAFTPDFTLSRISRTLTMKTSIKHLEALNYTLVASVPGHMLHSCSAVIPRPWWECWAYWLLNVGMAVVVIGVVAVAVCDAERLLNQSVFIMYQPLDLRSVAHSVNQDLGSNGSSRRTWHAAQATVQDVPASVVRKAPSFKRIFAIFRQFLRSFGIKMFALFKIFPRISWPTLRSSKESHQSEEQEEANKDDTKETDAEMDKKVKDAAKEHQASMKPNNSKNSGKNQQKLKLARKKSLPNNDFDESSSTTTESSIVDDLHDVRPHQGQVKTKNTKPTASKQKEIPSSSSASKEVLSNNPAPKSKQKAKKQNSLEGKRNSPERVANADSNHGGGKTAKKPVQQNPTTIKQTSSSANIKNEPLQQQSQVQAEQQQKKVTPVGKVLPDIKRPENIGAQFGPVGAKPLPMKPNWNVSNRNDLDANGFAMNNGQFGAPQAVSNQPPTPHFGGYQGNRDEFFHHGHSNSNPNSPSRQQPSFMSQLLNNRKQETAQFLRITNTDWPGFNENSAGPRAMEPNSYVESLWDDNPGSASHRTNIWNTWNNDQHHVQAGNNYIGGLSVGQQQRNNDPFRSHPRSTGPTMPVQPSAPADASFNGFQIDPLGLASSSIWASASPAPPSAGGQQGSTSNGERQEQQQHEHDELNQFQQRVMQPQQQQQPPTWSNLFRENK